MAEPIDKAFVRKYLGALAQLHDAIDKLREDFLESVTHAICENCLGVILDDDDCFRYSDGIVLCGKCAPTWAQAAEDWGEHLAAEPHDEDAREAHAKFVKAMEAHRANGGLDTDKCVSPY